VPAYFNDAQRGATLRAGQIAGFNVLNVINEPTAAALAYGLDRTGSEETVFVFDLGGGTFDTTIMKVEHEGIRMIATDGDGFLGGKDWDNLLADMVARSFIEKNGEDPREDLESHQDLLNRALGAKIQLSSRPRTTIVLNHNGRSHKLQVTREEFEEVAKPLVERLRKICEAVVHQAKLSWKEIDRILLVGGMTRMPMIREMLRDLSGKELTDSVNPDEAVAVGAAIQSVLCMLDEQQKTGEKLISDSIKNQYSTKEGKLIKVTNIATHTLGVVLWDNAKNREFVYPMIERGTRLPCEVNNKFGTSKPDMERITIRVVEGESRDPDMCSPIGTVELTLPNKLDKGTAVNVTYKYDSNQILQVIAKVGGEAAQVTIDRTAGMTENELQSAKEQFSKIKVD
jgi:molecular chaperone DnaK